MVIFPISVWSFSSLLVSLTAAGRHGVDDGKTSEIGEPSTKDRAFAIRALTSGLMNSSSPCGTDAVSACWSAG